jgi:ABC-2 type transport system permease protein
VIRSKRFGTNFRRFRSVARAVAWRNLHNFVTNPALLLPAVAFPLFFFTAFAGGLSQVENTPGFDYPNGYTAFEFGFVLLQAAAFGGVFTGFGIARDFESGFGRRLMLAAPNRYGVLAGYVISAMTRAVGVGVLLFGIALATGMDVSSSAVELGGLIGLALILSCAASLWAAGVAMRLRTIQAGPLMQTPVFLILFLSPVYVPVDLLQGWIHAVATINPLTPIVEAARSLIAGSTDGVGTAFLIAAGLATVFALWGRRGVQAAEAAGG